jgi:hypothetical protein
MSVEILDKTNTKAPRVILIDENYCLNDSFDIIQTNFKGLLDSLNQIDNKFFAQTVINRYNRNKSKYQNFLTYVTQFSGNWTDASQTYDKYRNVWNNIYTPLEIVYPSILSLGNWGSYSNGIITENTTVSLINIRQMLEWVNTNYPVHLYGLYKKINVRVYIYDLINDDFNFGVTYKEDCAPRGASGKVCCAGCAITHYGNKGCNKSIVNGNQQCANMYDWCPGRGNVTGFAEGQVQASRSTSSSNQCAEGSCSGWGLGYNATTWKGEDMNLTGKLTGQDKRLIGHQIINLTLNQNTGKWTR